MWALKYGGVHSRGYGRARDRRARDAFPVKPRHHRATPSGDSKWARAGAEARDANHPGASAPTRSPSIANISHLLLELRRAGVRVGEQRHVHAVRPHGRRGNSQRAIQRAGCLSGACRGRNAAHSGIAHFEAMRPEYEVAALCGLRSTLACRPWRSDEVLDGRLAGRCPTPTYRAGTSRTSLDTVRCFSRACAAPLSCPSTVHHSR